MAIVCAWQSACASCFFAYESAQYAEKRIAELKNKGSKFKEHMPEIYLVKAEKLIVYDNSDQSIQIVVNTNPLERSYDQTEATIKELEVLLGVPVSLRV